MKIFHNPRCGKSRQTLKILQERNQEVEIIEYLKSPPDRQELENVIKLLDIKPLDLIRKGEKIYIERYKGKNCSDNEWIKVMVENPILIERPIVISGARAVIGRPPENVLELL